MNPEQELNNLIRTGELDIRPLNNCDFKSDHEKIIMDYLDFKFIGKTRDFYEPEDQDFKWWAAIETESFMDHGFISYDTKDKMFIFWRSCDAEEVAFEQDYLLRTLHARFEAVRESSYESV